MSEPVICFGQQPCGFFPKRFLVAKMETARELQKKIGGQIIFFYHDSDHDYRETITVMTDRQTGKEARLNFTQDNKIQKKFSPLYAKRVPAGWKQEILKQLPRFVDNDLIGMFVGVEATTVADFCLAMYRELGLLEGIEIVRSGDRKVRQQAIDLPNDYFADVPYEGETVRARFQDGKLRLHEGGDRYIDLPPQNVEKWQKNPARDQRFPWMQSVVNCTHYVLGEGEGEYLDTASVPTVKFINRNLVNKPDFAWTS
jgi:hypothetical protein